MISGWQRPNERSTDMASSLQARVRRLEEAGAGGECPRCSGTTITCVNGGLRSVSKHGQQLEPEDAETFVCEEEDGCCPVCGARRTPIRIGWGEPHWS